MLALMYVVQSSFYLGLRREVPRADLDREWLARLDGIILAIIAGWSVFAFACVSLGPLLAYLSPALDLQGTAGGVTAAGVAASGGLAAWLARQAKSWAPEVAKNPTVKQQIDAALPTLLSVAFLLGLLAVVGGQVQANLGKVTVLLFATDTKPALAGWLHIVSQVVLALILCILITKLRKIDINRFSIHGLYRNRLVRAFLGTPRAKRRPDWFTDFDEDDNIRLASLKSGDGGPQKLFPVINLALNRSSGGPPGRGERMAASYTATPLHCGAEELAEQDPRRAFIRTQDFAGREDPKHRDGGAVPSGISLGSVVAASGAAASPNFGYHTSALTAFIMTLFNVRLGLWLPNPVSKANEPADLAQNRPPDAIRALLGDLIGRTTLDSRAIYLSDGGHFDNLGLYEMLRRRCELIVVVDASADPAGEFFDLGMAIRRAEIDLPVRVTMQKDMHIQSRKQIESDQEKARPMTALGVAVGKIEYLPAPGQATEVPVPPADRALDDWRREARTGRLIYIKPTYLPDIPVATRAYGAEHKTFPHETTADQFFSESQFESYHVLGWFQTSKIAEGHADLNALFDAATAHCNSRPPSGRE
ncbi:MAG: hypothetical protein EXR07_14145 [Acetobacteraceae bacterium]|nr:hypothetical protein [Acetobacteraceae bacterium]